MRDYINKEKSHIVQSGYKNLLVPTAAPDFVFLMDFQIHPAIAMYCL